MLKKRNDDYFMGHGIIKAGIVFFAQQWLELFDSRTIDTYQYSLGNVISVLQELAGTIDMTLDGRFPTYNNVEAVREEAYAFEISNCERKRGKNQSGATGKDET